MTAAKASPRFRRPPTAQEAVLAELRRAIVNGDLRPGEQVRQDALAEQYGVSRVPLREALKILEGEGQVIYRPHRGYFVATLDVDDLREVYRLRDLLESEAVRAAVPRLTDADVQQLCEASDEVDRAADVGDVTAMAVANRRFHFLLIEGAEMPRLARLTRVLWDATDAYRSVYYIDTSNRARVHEEHQAVVEAARARDSESVVQLLRAHREHAVVALAEALRSR
jgi:DNA-binding GntR family transcriptional regulator